MRDLIVNLIQDLRYAARMLRNSPTFTAIGILSLALGIGITSAVFSVADALLLRPLPVPRSSEISTISSTAPGVRAASAAVSYPDYADLRDANKSFQGLIAFAYLRAGMAGKATALPQLKEVLAVSGNYFSVFEVEPALGRGFFPEEDRVPGRNAVAVLSYRTWEQAFSADPKVIGRTVRLNDREFTIIGVAPETFIGTDSVIHPDLYIPIMMLPQVTDWGGSAISQRDSRSFTVKGRLKPGTNLAQAAAEMDTLGRRLADAYPSTNRNRRLLVRTELQARAAQAPQRLALSAMLLGLAGLVLMVACANVASLLFGRGAARSREMAVRLAVGARPSRLVRQLLTESLLLALAGGGLGLLLAKLGVNYLANIVSFSTDLPQYISFRLDQRVLVFNFVIAVMSALAFGLAPAIRGAKTDLVAALKTGTGNGSGGRARIRNVLVVGQVALALMLLSGEALFIRTFQSMGFASPGFRTDHLVMMSFDPSLVRYTSEQTGKFHQTLIERARQLPGVNHAAFSQMTPTEFIPPSASVAPEGFQFPPDRESQSDSVYTYTVGDQYFETIGTPLVSGRGFRVTDTAASPRVAVINEVFAEKYWPGLNPVGKRFRLGDRRGPWVEVVGVAKTTWYAFVGEDRVPFFYLPMAQNPKVAMTLMVETATPDAAASIGPLRDLVSSIDGRQPVFNVRTMSEYYPRQSLQALRIVVQLVGTMGLLGLSLALIGIYALVAYSVSRRTREIGIRMAIGAGRLDILRLVLGQGLTLALIGAGLGLAGSFGLVRSIRALFTRLQERGIFDAWTFVAVPLALIAVAVVATYIPARRAAAIDPNRALHYE
jgi:macrolide transport system ATP-binding/permease protein